MALDNGYGAVTEKNVLAFQDTFPSDFLTAARHGNGRDWWILLPKFNSKRYYAFLLSPEGISGPYLQENIALPVDVKGWGSQAVFSPNGKKYATASFTAGLQVFNFDRCTGKLSNPKNIEIEFENSYSRGVAFSSNSRYLYVSSGSKLQQFDTRADSLMEGRTLIGVYDSFGLGGQGGSLPTTFYQQMLAPNGKIYITTSNGTKYLHVIHKPNEAGAACDFEQRGIGLLTYHSFSPPNFPHFRLYDFQDSPCDTLGINGPPPPEDTTPPPPVCAGSIRIFPNPARSLALIEMPECQGGSVSVFDVMGRWVEDLQLEEESMSTTLDVSAYVAGIYFLRIRTATGEKVTKRLMVMR
jgi:WD40 repeat protein